MQEFTPEEIFSAYRKLTHYYYYDNTSLFLRQRLALFEDELTINSNSIDIDFNTAFTIWTQKTANDLNKRSIKYWKEYFQKNIEYRITPKAFKRKDHTFITIDAILV